MKILFLCPDYFGIYSIIEEGIRRNMDCQLTSIIFTRYKYKNSFEKFANFLSKTFLNKNLKKIWASKERMDSVKDHGRFDYIFVISPEFMQLYDLQILIGRSDRSIVYYWDSFANIPKYKKSFSLFDVHFTFEPKDAEDCKMKFLTNFYSQEIRNQETENDLFYIGTLDERFPTLLKILRSAEKLKLSAKIFLLTTKKIENDFPDMISFIDTVIPFRESEKIYAKSRVILDVQKTVQNGLTFRVFEAMGQHKKLITTNTDIVNYDFYDAQNIFVWNAETTELPSSFFEAPYRELPGKIYKRYNIDSWVKTIFAVE